VHDCMGLDGLGCQHVGSLFEDVINRFAINRFSRQVVISPVATVLIKTDRTLMDCTFC
jgi:hypothetical protein